MQIFSNVLSFKINYESFCEKSPVLQIDFLILKNIESSGLSWLVSCIHIFINALQLQSVWFVFFLLHYFPYRWLQIESIILADLLFYSATWSNATSSRWCSKATYRM